MFELLTPHKSTFIKSETLSQKNRPADELPGVKIIVETQFAADLLEHLSPDLSELLFEPVPNGNAKKASAQPDLAGIPEKPAAKVRLTQAAISLAKLKWKPELSGYAIEIIRGTGRAASNIHLRDCMVSFPAIQGKEPDQCLARIVIESGNIPDEAWSRFARLKSRACEITLKAPEVVQKSIEEAEAEEFEKGAKASLAKSKAPARKPGAPERAAVAKVKGGKAEPPKGKPTKAASTVSGEAAWPFPKGQKPDAEAPPQSVTVERSQPGTRTARGRDATAAFLAAHKGEGTKVQ